MPETIKSLIIILTLGSIILHLQRMSLPKIISTTEFKQLSLLWLASSFIIFLSNNYWLSLFLLAALLILLVKGSRITQFSGYIWLLPLFPLLAKEIPGLGSIRFLFELNYPRTLSLVILFPLFLSQSDKTKAFFRLPGDKIIALYLLVNIYITFRNGALSNILRSDLYLFLDIFLPYYVASRVFNRFQDFKQIAFVIFSSVSILASIAIFEILKSWHLYSILTSSLNVVNSGDSDYLFREGFLRATGPFSSSIVLGYVLTIAIGMGLCIKSSFKKKIHLQLLFLLYIVALLSTMARGPWIGASVLYIVFMVLNKDIIKLLRQGILAAIAFSPLFFFSSYGQKLILLLPFIGHSDEGAGTISYRQELFEKSWTVIQRHPFFGSNTYLDSPEMQSMIQGQGIIDIVNSYLQIALESGLIGAGLFIFFFLSLLLRLYKIQKRIPKNEAEFNLFASGLIATTVGVLFIIATVSSIDIVSHLYWLLAGILTAYLNFLRKEL
jgi:O-antigen ligase